MRTFKVTADRRIFLNDVEVESVLGFSVEAKALSDPEVVLRVAVDRIEMDGYTDAYQTTKKSLSGGGTPSRSGE